MRRKNNPWVALVAALLLALILVFTLTDCGAAEAAEPGTTENLPRFVVERLDTNVVYAATYIITDTETGVQYLMVRHQQGTGLTKLEPAPESEAET